MAERSLHRLRAAAILALPLVTWLPLLILSAIDGKLLPKTVTTPFLVDLSAHVRFLVALPLFLIAGLVAAARMMPTLRQFLARELVPEESIGRFNDAISSALRLGDSVVADLVIIVLIYIFDAIVVRRSYDAVTAWHSMPGANGVTLTPAGFCFLYVSLPIFEFVLLRWYYRLFIWGRFLAQVSRLKLRLVPTNPDRVGGLGFLLLGTQAFTVFAMAQGAQLTAWLAARVLVKGTSLAEFKAEIVLVLIFVLCITIGPLLVFTRMLARAKRRGVFEYGALASRYAREFDDKWVRAKQTCEEPLVGSADVQSLADMGGSYDLVQSMRTLPFTPQMIISFCVVTLVPVAPLLLTLMPLSDILKKLVSIVF